MEKGVVQDNIAMLINFSWATYRIMHLKVIYARYSSVMEELQSCVCIVNRMTGARVHKAETTLRECLITVLLHSKISKLLPRC